MTAYKFLEFVQTWFKLQASYALQDFADKLNFLYSVIVLTICLALVMLRMYIMKPINCYLSNDPGGLNMLDYAENYCWVEGTVPQYYDHKLPESHEEWRHFNKRKTVYYQWVPFMLGIQCILFYLPRIIWQLICYNQTGTDVQHMVTSANQAVHADAETRQKLVINLAKTLEQMLFQHRVFRKRSKRVTLRDRVFKVCGFCMMSKRMGTWLMFSYICLKLIYLLNAVGQVFMMQRFLGVGPHYNTNFTLFGIELVKNVINGRDWESTLVFPRVGFCYAPIKQLGALNSVTAQCVLPGNMLNEKIYVFLWFWIVLVAIITALSIPVWLVRMAHDKNRKNFIKKFLKLNEKLDVKDKKEKKLVKKFTDHFLRHDGVFLLRMISLNAGDVITADIVCQLWNIFKTKYQNHNFLEAPEEQTLRVRLDSIVQSGGVIKTPTAPVNYEEDETIVLKRQQSVHV